MENNNKITEEQLEEIVGVLEENASEQTKILRKIKEESAGQSYPVNAINKGELKSSVENVSVSDTTLERSVVSNPEVNHNENSIVELLSDEEERQMTEEEFVNDKDYIETANSLDMGMSEEEINKFLKVMFRFKSGEKFKVYPELPEKAQAFCRQMSQGYIESMGASGKTMTMQELAVTLENVSKDVVRMFMNEMEKDKGYSDLQKSLEEELKIPGLIDMYNNQQDEIMSVKMLEKADLLEEKFPEKAKTLRLISAKFLDAKGFETLTKLAESHSKETKRLDKDVKKYARFCREFNYKYNNSEFIIKDCSLMSMAISRVVDQNKYDTDDIKKFIIFFCKVCNNMKATDLVEHTFMYYTVSTVICLDRLRADNKYLEESVKKIEHIMDLLK